MIRITEGAFPEYLLQQHFYPLHLLQFGVEVQLGISYVF